MAILDYVIFRRSAIAAIALLVIIYTFEMGPTVANSTKSVLCSPTSAVENDDGATQPFRIKDKVAMISDTQFSARTIPLILHFRSVLGEDWPIVFYTSKETAEAHFEYNTSTNTATNVGTGSAIWNQAVKQGAIDVRIVPEEFNMTSRYGVNLFLSRPWLWEQLAPAKHVLVFQTDAMLCANSHHTMDDFLVWDFIGAPMHTHEKLYNGGLSLRNRPMMMEILQNPANNWEKELEAGTWTMGGEDIWFSAKMDDMGANLPDFDQAVSFSCQHAWHTDRMKEPLGYHKVHKNAAQKLDEIAAWCPEIALAAPGSLAQGDSVH